MVAVRLSGIWRDDVDSMIYVGMGEQVMRSPMKKMKWEEAYCLPGENKKFTRIACNGKHVLAVTDNYQKHFYEWNNKDLKGEPKISQEPHHRYRRYLRHVRHVW